MENIMACRVCLVTDVKLYEMCKYRLKTAYENLTGINMSRYCLQRVCSFCGTMLNNIMTFKERCVRSQQVLEMLVKEHVLVTTSHIKSINRHSHNLSLPYTKQHTQNIDSTITRQNFDANVTRQNFDPNITRQNYDTNDTRQNFDPNVRRQFDPNVTIQNFDTNITRHNYDTNDTRQNVDTNVTTQSFDSTITVKNEYDHFESDNEDYDYKYDCNNDAEIKNNTNHKYDENVEYYKYSDIEKKQYDTDEEPLSKKVKKKRKKNKIKTHKHSVKLRKYDKIDIKTENGQICLTNNRDISINDPNFPRNNQNFPTVDQNCLNETNDPNFPTVDQNCLNETNDPNFPTVDQNFPTNDPNFSTVDQNFPTYDHNVPNQVLDLEIEHKLVFLSKQEQIEEVLSRKTSSNYLNSVYKCELCFKGFMTDATYKNHMARHDESCGPVACLVCATRWPDARALRAHTLISHERRYICKVCGHTSRSSHKAKEHTQWHAGVTFPCHSCGRSFTKSTSYLTHVRLRHATHVCDLCAQTFIGENGLNMHKKKAHRNKADPSVLHECDRCRVKFRSTAALHRHCDVSGGECDDTLFVCMQCGDHCASDQLLKEHTDMHLKTDALRTCSQCSRTFANERSLAAHIQRTHARTHTQAPRHCVCEVCGYKCMSANSLVNHQRVHSGEKPHACLHCNKRFSVAQRLQIHVRTHTGERPFQCSRCPKAFKHKAALNRHDRVHTGVKPYSCPQCGKCFSQSNSMKQHCAGVHMKTYIYSRRNKQ